MPEESLDGPIAEEIPPKTGAWEAIKLRWALAPALAGFALVVALAGGAVTAVRDDALKQALFAPAALPFTAGLGVVTLVAGVGLVAAGVALDRLARENRFLALTQEGLVEEISQEFHKVRDAMDETSERVRAQSGRVSRVASAASRLEAAQLDHEARLSHLEDRGARAERFTPVPVAQRGGSRETSARGGPLPDAPLAADADVTVGAVGARPKV